MGTPSATEPWGWQIDGHHVIINYFVLGDQVVMTPTFVGSEPVTATSGKYAGTSVLQDEQNRGLAFMTSLDAAARAKAIVAAAKTGNNNLTEAFKDNVVLAYAGRQGVRAAAGGAGRARRPDRPLRRDHGRRARQGEDERGEGAPRRHLLRVDRRDRRRTRCSTTASTAR